MVFIGPNGERLVPPKIESTGIQRSNSLFGQESKGRPYQTKVRSNSYSSFNTGGSKDSKGSRGSFNPRKIPWEWKVTHTSFLPSEVETDAINDSNTLSNNSDEPHEKLESLSNHGNDEDDMLRMEGIFNKSIVSEVHDVNSETLHLLVSQEDFVFSPVKVYGAASMDHIQLHSNIPSHHQEPILGKSQKQRSLRRRIFLIMTDPSSSYTSLAFFYLLSMMILSSNIVMMMETMSNFQYRPDDCEFCHDQIQISDSNSDDQVSRLLYRHTYSCVCPPKAYDWISTLQDHIIFFFTVELILRIICFDPGPNDPKQKSIWNFLTEMQMIIDALATFPYYLEKLDALKTFFPVRMLRLFRVFQFIRLGQYDSTFCALVNVFTNSVKHLSILCMALVFSGGFFGYLIYWFEKGEWEHTDLVDPPNYAFVRIGIDGVTKEISPFKSIPDSFWWFIVTATTVGYGDVCPTSFGGKCVASAAMIFGVFVVAFPVSIFAELWRNQLKALRVIHSDDGSQGEFEDHTLKDEIYPSEISAKIDVSSNQQNLEDDIAAAYSNFDDEMEEIYRCMSIIDAAQQKIRTTLRNIESSRRKIN